MLTNELSINEMRSYHVTVRWMNSCWVAESCLTLRARLQPSRPLCPRGSPGKNTGAGCHLLLQGLFSDHGSSLHLLYWQADSLPPSHQGSQEHTQNKTDEVDAFSLILFIVASRSWESTPNGHHLTPYVQGSGHHLTVVKSEFTVPTKPTASCL